MKDILYKNKEDINCELSQIIKNKKKLLLKLSLYTMLHTSNGINWFPGVDEFEMIKVYES